MAVQFGAAKGASKPGSLPAGKPAGTPAKTTQQSGVKKVSGFLMTGQDTHKAIAEETARMEMAQEEAGRLWRFYIKQDECGVERTITFLDGDVDETTGLLNMPSWYEHQFMVGGRPKEFICVGGQEPCPMCATDAKRALVFGFTIIDHTQFEIKKGEHAGEVREWSRKLYVCKKKTASQLQIMASKYGGLKGLQLSVVRAGAMSPNTGDTFLPVQKYDDNELAELFGEAANPANFEEELIYRTAEELVAQGIVEPLKAVSSPPSGGSFKTQF